jgi:hypothetical protein
MAKNLLKWWPNLTEEDLKTIEFAVRNCSHGRASAAHPLLDRKVAIAALLAANRVFGTALHATVRKLKANHSK